MKNAPESLKIKQNKVFKNEFYCDFQKIFDFFFSEAPEEVVERDEIRYERQQERRRERNIARMAPERRSKLQKDKERDISEKIALGVPDPKVRTNETQFDQRLFNQSKVLFFTKIN